jgi:quercetin dioxygenase-like cupin family protein
MSMPTRRQMLESIALLAGLAASANASAAQAPQPARGPVFRQDLPDLTMEGWEVTVSYVDLAPGRVGSAHRHPGFVLVYVLNGEVVTKISGQEQRTYRTGEMFFEPPGSTHEVSSNASETQPARLLAMIFAKKNSPLTAPAL